MGNGESIRIWRDKWITTPTSYEIQSPIRILDSEAKVSKLIDTDSKWWNIALIQEIFNPEEAKKICSMTLVWAGNPNWMFTVRSSYHLEKARVLGEKGECSTVSCFSETWKKLWKMKVPGVVRVCNNLLPTKENLCRKGIVKDPMCHICCAWLETIGHILSKCNSATGVWMECNRKIEKLSLDVDDGIRLVGKWIELLGDDDLELVVLVTRNIWLRRNSVVYGGDLMSPKQVSISAQEALAGFKEAIVDQERGLGRLKGPG